LAAASNIPLERVAFCKRMISWEDEMKPSALGISSIVTFVSLVLAASSGSAQTQTPGQITQFDPLLNVVDSVISQEANGNIGIGTTTPVAALDVASGNLNVAGNLLKGGLLFLHSSGGFANTFVGQNAGNLSMTGYQNTACGFGALQAATTGVANTANGYNALGLNTIGVYNTANGVLALANNSEGGINTAIGLEALYGNTTGGSNMASGAFALRNNMSGYSNTATGDDALSNNLTGDLNTASGYWALLGNQSGANNTAIGAFADVSEGNLTNATAVGFAAVVNDSNKIRLGNSSVNVIEGQVPYTFTSDKMQKENFRAVDGETVLRKLGDVNITSWNYIGHDPERFRHYGPVAQEFYAAFGHDSMGTIGTPTTINSGDLEGILMIAVQALEKRTVENAELKARIEALEQLVKGRVADQR
jgi:hypothetical protein